MEGMGMPKFTRVMLTSCFGLDWILGRDCTYGDAAGHFEAYFGFSPNGKVHKT